MRLLVDTHVAVWWLDGTLDPETTDLLNHEPDVYLSAVSVWEVAIKQALGKIAPADLAERLAASGLRLLAIGVEHALAAGRLPPVHGDPFDRMLVAQAQLEDLTLVTRDATIQRYDVPTLKV